MAASGDDLVEDVVEDICFDVVAVLPAGGCGVRMNLEIPKQVYNRFIPGGIGHGPNTKKDVFS